MISTFAMPPIIISGKNSSLQLGQIAKKLGIDRLLVIVSSSLVDEVGEILTDQLIKEKIVFTIYTCQKGEPTTQQMEEALQIQNETNSNGVIAIGGGSVIDLAKAVSTFALNKEQTLDSISKLPVVKRLPLIAIPTTAGSGSESTKVMVITDHITNSKKNPAHPMLVPDAAILDARWLQKLPITLRVFTGMDALTHAIEAFVSTEANNLSDMYALKAIQLIYSALPKIYEDTKDESAYQEIMLGSTFAGIAFSNASTNLAHATARAIGAKLNIPHGLSVALLHPFVIKFGLEACQDRYAEIAIALGFDARKSKEELANDVLQIIEDFNVRFGIWEEGKNYVQALNQKCIHELTEQALVGNGILTNRKIPSYKDIEHVFKELSNTLNDYLCTQTKLGGI